MSTSVPRSTSSSTAPARRPSSRREIASIRGFFVDASGSPRTDNILKVVGGAAGAVALFVIARKIVK